MNESLSTKDAKKLNKASVLSTSTNPKDQDRARARQTEVDYKDLLRQLKAKRKKVNEASAVFSIGKRANTAIKREKDKKELKRLLGKAAAMKKQGSNYHPYLHDPKESFEIDKSAHKKVQKKAKLRNLAKGNMNPNEKAAAEKKAGGPKLIGERLGGKGYKPRKDYAGRTVSGDWEDSDRGAGNKATRRAGGKVKKKSPTYQAYVLNKEEDNYGQAKKELKATKKARDERHNAIHSGTNTSKNTDVNEGKTFDAWKKAAASALGRKKKQEKKPSMDSTTRKLHKWRTDKEQAEREKYVTFTKPVEDD